MQSAQGTFGLADALPTLAKSRKAMAGLKKELGSDHFDEAAAMMRAASLTGALGDQVDDFFADEIANDAETVWEAEAQGGEDTYSVEVMEYAGVFFVAAQQHNSVGYFLSLQDAQGWARSNWKLSNASTPPSRKVATFWDKQEKALHEKLRASGRTVTVMEPSDSNELTVTFPMGRSGR